NGQVTLLSGQLVVAGRTEGGGKLAGCTDSTNGGAFFLPIASEDTGGGGAPVIVHSTAPGAVWGGDYGLAGGGTSERDFLGAASADGAVTLDHDIPAPPAPDPTSDAYWVNLVFARVPAP